MKNRPIIFLLLFFYSFALNAQLLKNEGAVDSLCMALAKTKLIDNLKSSAEGEVYFLVAQMNKNTVQTVYLLTPRASGMDTSQIEDSDLMKVKQPLINVSQMKPVNLIVPLFYIENPRRSAKGSFFIDDESLNRIFTHLNKITNNLHTTVVVPVQMRVSFPVTVS